ncbi:MAG: hypothetical protein DDT19_02417 [Syntrophomonadaceae bacterium]|nr:hypothetical protein [Bacillota bacterium]
MVPSAYQQARVVLLDGILRQTIMPIMARMMPLALIDGRGHLSERL